jgi:prophage regulatory protein
MSAVSEPLACDIAAMAPRLLRLGQVKSRTGLSRSTIYRRMRNGTFPMPCKSGPNITLWSAAEISIWAQALLATRGEAA